MVDIRLIQFDVWFVVIGPCKFPGVFRHHTLVIFPPTLSSLPRFILNICSLCPVEIFIAVFRRCDEAVRKSVGHIEKVKIRLFFLFYSPFLYLYI